MIPITRPTRFIVHSARLSVARGLALLMLFAGAAKAAKAQLTVAVGTTSATQTATVYATTGGKTASTTATAFLVLTQGATGLDFNFVSGGTCAVSTTYAQGVQCTVKYTFKPKYSGVRQGAVQLVSSAGVVMGTTFISGVGTGPQANFPQATISALPGTYTQPRSIAMDGAGNVYIANYGGGTLVKIPAGCATSSCVTTIGSFVGPASVALDGAGNIYVADYTNSAIIQILANCSSACTTSLGSTFSVNFYDPLGIAVDGNGNVFVADDGFSNIIELPIYACRLNSNNCVANSLGTGFSGQQDVAVDASGTVYIADYGNNAVKSMPANCNELSGGCTITTLGAGFSLPSGVAVDGNGNVYVGDSGNNAVKVMTPNCTAANAGTCVATISGTFSSPIGVTLDGSGNLYVADNGNNAVREILRATPPSVSFPNVVDGSTGTAQTVTLTNYGNAALTIAEPSSGVNPSVSSGFTLATVGGCPSVSAGGTAATLAANASCSLKINFAPVSPDSGAVTGSVVVTDNSGNVTGSTQTIALSGTAGSPTVTGISPSAGSTAGGTSVTITGTNFGSGATVSFGSAASPSVVINSLTSITAISPASAAGTVHVTVTAGGNKSATSSADQFTYAPPTVTGISPISGSTAGGTNVTITGTNFVSGSTVSFGATASTGVTVNSSTSITAVSPAGAAGTVNVTVTAGGATSATSTSDQFTYVVPPVVTGISPAVGPPAGGTSVTITGTGFASGATVSFGSTAATGVTVKSSISITATAPAGVGTVDVTVTLNGVSSATSAVDQFAYLFSQNVRSTSATQVATVTIATAGTLGTIDVLTTGQPNQDYAFVSGGTCATGTAYSAGATCTVYYTFRPKAPGARNGAVQLVASGGTTVLGTALITGLGLGPAVMYPTNQTTPTLGSGLVNPQNIAVDAAGNVYVADSGNNAVYEMVAVSGSIPANPTIRSLGSGYRRPSGGTGFNAPQGVAVDGAGNVYVADTGDGAVLEIMAVGGSVPTSNQMIRYVGDGAFYTPLAVAVDGVGNVYVTDNYNGVYKITAATNHSSLLYVASNLSGIALDAYGNIFFGDLNASAVDEFDAASGNVVALSYAFNNPDAVAVDAAGDVYVADAGNGPGSGFLREIVAVNGSIPSTNPTILSLATLATGFTSLTGVAVDGAGNVYVSDNGSGVAYEITTATAPSLSFAATPVGSTSGAQSLSLQNFGNETLTFSVPSGQNNPTISSNFNLASTCPIVTSGGTAATLVAGGLCTESISSTPAAYGPYSGSLAFTDNTLNVASSHQTISLSGLGGSTPTVTAVSPASGPVTGGTTVTVTGTNFVSGTTVSFGGTAATGVTVVNSTSLTAVTPAAALGMVDVTVTTPDGTSPTNAADSFTYTSIAPTVTAIFPASGPVTGGTSVTITGTNFVSGATVSFGTTAATGVTFISSTSITAIAPAGSATVDVTVTAKGVTSATSLADQFTYVLIENVGSTTTTRTASVTVTTAGTLGAIDVLTTGQPNLDFAFVTGGTCATGTAYAANAVCTVEYTFKPRAPGVRLGAVQLVASGGTSVLGTTLLAGTGSGPAVAYPTNQTIATLGSGFNEPYSMAVDAAGNVFVADFKNNAVKEIVAVSGSIPASPTIRTLGSGFNEPTGVAVDGAGNVFVADFGNHQVKEIVAVGGSIPASSPTILELQSGSFFGPLGIALDAAGNVYVSDATQGQVEEIVAETGSVTQLGNSATFNNPEGIAVDGSGNVFVADFGDNAVREIVAASGAVVTLGSSFTNPNWVAVDAAGDVYVADGASATVSEILAVNGSIPSSSPTILTLGTGFTTPTGVALDGAGNVYIADYGQSRVFEIATATTPSLSFATTNVGSTSSAQSFSLQNIGNANLTLAVPGSGKNPAITSGFTFASTCPIVSAGGSAGTLAEGGLCMESISFAPVSGGLDNGSLTFTDNNLNVASSTQAIGLSGTGNGTGTLAVTAISPTSGSAAGGSTVTITGTNFTSSATVSFGGTAATGVTFLSATQVTAISPAGNLGAVDVTVTTSAGTSAAVTADKFTYTAIASTITFPALANAVIGATPPTLSATSNSPAAITYNSTTTSVCTVASGVITDVAGGTCSITASQAASGNYAAATPVSRSYTVTVPLVFVAGSGKLESLAGDGSLTSAATGNGGVGAAVDSSGHVWSIDASGTGISRFNYLGAGQNDYNTIGLVGASALAIDGNSQIWVTNSNGTVAVLSNAGAVVSTIQGSTTAAPTGVAIDISGNVWITNKAASTVDEVIGGAAPALPLSTAVTTNKTGARP